MENASIILCFPLILIIFSYQSVMIIIIDKKRKELINDYEKLLHLKDCYEKISVEAGRSDIIESVEKRGNELINQLNLLNSNLIEIQEQQKKLQEQQQKLHSNLLEEHKLLNQYFENYS